MAQPIQTHYDNLKVMRNARVQEIKAAYRRLAQEYHPDRNQGADALRIMKTINLAWDVLSDPERRASHDRWIADQEQLAMQGRPGVQAQRPASPPSRSQSAAPVPGPFPRKAVMAAAAALLLIAGAAAVHMVQRPAEEAELDVVSTAGSGGDFAAIASNARGHDVEEEEEFGPAYFDFNNTAGTHEVEVHVFRDGKPSRRVFVPAGQRYSLNDLAYGHFTLHYKAMVDGKLRTYRANETFALVPTPEELARKRYDVYSKNRRSMFNFADGKATEIPAEQF